jgi:His-Xaa-Ser system radical SAM maturase HxsC
MDLKFRKEAIELYANIVPIPGGQTFLAAVVTDKEAVPKINRAFLVQDQSCVPLGFSIYLVPESIQAVATPEGAICVVVPNKLSHIDAGDIVRINAAAGELLILFRASSPSNSILLTERCNSWCVMCSQPPRNRDDEWIADEWLRILPLIPKNTESIGITGGEPTLLGRKFIEVIAACVEHLPTTSLHVLSNGRNFAYLSLAKALSDLKHPALTVAIPLYSDVAWRHEFVVQARNSFDDTIRGILNLARCGISVEIRIVLHRLTIPRLKHLATYIVRNFPFVSHVALMGLEPIGFARANYDALWVDPVDYATDLTEAVDVLFHGKISFSIYNHQLCTIPQHLWPFSVNSISDWKNIYLDECFGCDLRDKCGGFFHSAVDKYSRSIKSIKL